MAILYLEIAAVAQLCLLAWPLARQLRIRIGLRLMGIVGSLLAMEIHTRVTRIIGRCGRLLFLRLKALQARPSLHQRAIHRKVFVGNQTRFPRSLYHLRQELLGHRPLQQAVAVLGKRGGIPNNLIQVQAHKPAEQNAIVDLLHQQPLAPHRIEHLQQLRPQKLLRGNRRPPAFGIHGVEQRRHRIQNLVRHRPHRTQWMILPHPLLWRQVTEHIRLLMIDSSHDSFLTNHAVELK